MQILDGLIGDAVWGWMRSSERELMSLMLVLKLEIVGGEIG